jgi:hypothetical protein
VAGVVTGERDVAAAAPHVEHLVRGQSVRGAVDRDRARAADVEHAQLASLAEVLGAQVLEVGERERRGERHRGAEHHAIEVDRAERDLAWPEQAGDEEVGAQLVGAHARRGGRVGEVVHRLLSGYVAGGGRMRAHRAIHPPSTTSTCPLT